MITAHVPVKNARIPVLRFTLCLTQGNIPCELSIQNLLGEAKANLVGNLVKSETSGNTKIYL